MHLYTSAEVYAQVLPACWVLMERLKQRQDGLLGCSTDDMPIGEMLHVEVSDQEERDA
jgi:hypothetical protein